MQEEKVSQILLMVRDNIPEERLPMLRDALEKADDSKFDMLVMMPLKKSLNTLLFSIFLGYLGVDRFYIGDTGLGVGKIFLNIITCGIFTFVDIFFSYRKCKEKNFNSLMMAL